MNYHHIDNNKRSSVYQNIMIILKKHNMDNLHAFFFFLIISNSYVVTKYSDYNIDCDIFSKLFSILNLEIDTQII